MDFITAPLVVGFITLGIYKLFELFVCKRERLTIIEKLGEKIGNVDLSGKFTLPGYGKPNFSFSALKAGCLMLGVGLGLLIGFLISYGMLPDYGVKNNWRAESVAAIVYGACLLLFGGMGLITAFIIELKIGKKETKQ